LDKRGRNVTDERAEPGASQDADPRCHRDAKWRRRGAMEGIRPVGRI